MGLQSYQDSEDILYIAPETKGDVSFQEKNLGFPVRMVTQKDFLSRVYGDYKGFICIFQKTSDGIEKNIFYRKRESKRLESFLEKTFGIDTYISYSTFKSKKKTKERTKLRTQDNIVHTYMLVQDLDYYKLGITDAEFLEGIGEMIRNGEILCPSYIISTGRGYQLVWLVEPFKNIKNYTNDKHWRSIQNHLFDILKDFNSDSVVKTPSAVVRLVGTRHRKTRNEVYAYLANQKIFNLKDFLFFHNIAPLSDRKVTAPKTKSKNKQNKGVTRLVSSWNEFTLNRQRENDIFTFVQVKNERGEAYHAKRNWLALVLAFHGLVSSEGDIDYAEQRVKDLCCEMDLTETSEEEILRRSLVPAQRYYQEWVDGTWDNERYLQGGLFYKNATMLDLLGIKEDYYMQWKMKTIKIKSKAYEAARKRFEKFGEEEAEKHTWEAYQERRSERNAEKKEDKLWLLQKAVERYPELSQRKLAKHMGWSLETTRKYLKILIGKI